MARRTTKMISLNIARAETMITNSLADDAILKLIGRFGYDAEKLNAGKSLLDSAKAIKDAYVANHGAQKQATAAAKKAKNEAIAAFQSLSELARGEFRKKKEVLTTVGLDKPMPKREADFIQSGLTLFVNTSAVDEMKSAMAKYGYDDARLNEGKSKIIAFQAAADARIAAEGTAQDTTESLRKAMKELNEWLSQYKRVASVAMKQNKELLEKLGIRVRAGKTAAQRQAPAKAAATKKAKKAGGNRLR